jgi:beta-phosphoglucomutase-like phosphatase (HAD superfamily)
LQAAREANVAAERCIVIENAPLGIEAAHRAGMFCIAVESTLPAEYLAGADMIVRTIGDVGPLLCEEG